LICYYLVVISNYYRKMTEITCTLYDGQIEILTSLSKLNDVTFASKVKYITCSRMRLKSIDEIVI
jgi:hypothetical protein